MCHAVEWNSMENSCQTPTENFLFHCGSLQLFAEPLFVALQTQNNSFFLFYTTHSSVNNDNGWNCSHSWILNWFSTAAREPTRKRELRMGQRRWRCWQTKSGGKKLFDERVCKSLRAILKNCFLLISLALEQWAKKPFISHTALFPLFLWMRRRWNGISIKPFLADSWTKWKLFPTLKFTPSSSSSMLFSVWEKYLPCH